MCQASARLELITGLPSRCLAGLDDREGAQVGAGGKDGLDIRGPHRPHRWLLRRSRSAMRATMAFLGLAKGAHADRFQIIARATGRRPHRRPLPRKGETTPTLVTSRCLQRRHHRTCRIGDLCRAMRPFEPPRRPRLLRSRWPRRCRRSRRRPSACWPGRSRSRPGEAVLHQHQRFRAKRPEHSRSGCDRAPARVVVKDRTEFPFDGLVGRQHDQPERLLALFHAGHRVSKGQLHGLLSAVLSRAASTAISGGGRAWSGTPGRRRG